MQDTRIYPTALDDAHELGLVRERMQQLWDHYGGREAVQHPEYKRMRKRERVLAKRVFPGLHRPA